MSLKSISGLGPHVEQRLRNVHVLDLRVVREASVRQRHPSRPCHTFESSLVFDDGGFSRKTSISAGASTSRVAVAGFGKGGRRHAADSKQQRERDRASRQSHRSSPRESGWERMLSGQYRAFSAPRYLPIP